MLPFRRPTTVVGSCMLFTASASPLLAASLHFKSTKAAAGKTSTAAASGAAVAAKGSSPSSSSTSSTEALGSPSSPISAAAPKAAAASRVVVKEKGQKKTSAAQLRRQEEDEKKQRKQAALDLIKQASAKIDAVRNPKFISQAEAAAKEKQQQQQQQQQQAILSAKSGAAAATASTSSTVLGLSMTTETGVASAATGAADNNTSVASSSSAASLPNAVNIDSSTAAAAEASASAGSPLSVLTELGEPSSSSAALSATPHSSFANGASAASAVQNRICWAEVQERMQAACVQLASCTPNAASVVLNGARQMIRQLEISFMFLPEPRVCIAEHEDALTPSVALELVCCAQKFSLPLQSPFVAGLLCYLTESVRRHEFLNVSNGTAHVMQLVNGAGTVGHLRVWDERVFHVFRDQLRAALSQAGLREVMTILNGIGQKELGVTRAQQSASLSPGSADGHLLSLSEENDAISGSNNGGGAVGDGDDAFDGGSNSNKTTSSSLLITPSRLIPCLLEAVAERLDALVSETVREFNVGATSATTTTTTTTTTPTTTTSPLATTAETAATSTEEQVAASATATSDGVAESTSSPERTASGAAEQQSQTSFDTDGGLGAVAATANAAATTTSIRGPSTQNNALVVDAILSFSDSVLASDPLMRDRYLSRWILSLVEAVPSAAAFHGAIQAASTLRLDNVFFPALRRAYEMRESLSTAALAKTLSAVMLLPRRPMLEVSFTFAAADNDATITTATTAFLEPSRALTVGDVLCVAREHLIAQLSARNERSDNVCIVSVHDEEKKQQQGSASARSVVLFDAASCENNIADALQWPCSNWSTHAAVTVRYSCSAAATASDSDNSDNASKKDQQHHNKQKTHALSSTSTGSSSSSGSSASTKNKIALDSLLFYVADRIVSRQAHEADCLATSRTGGRATYYNTAPSRTTNDVCQDLASFLAGSIALHVTAHPAVLKTADFFYHVLLGQKRSGTSLLGSLSSNNNISNRKITQASATAAEGNGNDAHEDAAAGEEEEAEDGGDSVNSSTGRRSNSNNNNNNNNNNKGAELPVGSVERLTGELEFLALAPHFCNREETHALLASVLRQVREKLRDADMRNRSRLLTCNQLRLLCCSTLAVKYDLPADVATFVLANFVELVNEATLSDVSAVIYTVGRTGIVVPAQSHDAIARRVLTILKFSKATKRFVSASGASNNNSSSNGGSASSNELSAHDLAVTLSGLHLTKFRWDNNPALFGQLAEAISTRKTRYTPAQCCQIVAISRDVARVAQQRQKNAAAAAAQAQQQQQQTQTSSSSLISASSSSVALGAVSPANKHIFLYHLHRDATLLARVFLPQIRVSIPTATDGDLMPLLAWLSTGHIRDVSLLDLMVERLISVKARPNIIMSVLESVHCMGLLGGLNSDGVFRLVATTLQNGGNSNKDSDAVVNTKNKFNNKSNNNNNNNNVYSSADAATTFTGEQAAQLAFYVTQLRNRDAALVKQLVARARKGNNNTMSGESDAAVAAASTAAASDEDDGCRSIKALCSAIGALSLVQVPWRSAEMRALTSRLEAALNAHDAAAVAADETTVPAKFRALSAEEKLKRQDGDDVDDFDDAEDGAAESTASSSSSSSSSSALAARPSSKSKAKQSSATAAAADSSKSFSSGDFPKQPPDLRLPETTSEEAEQQHDSGSKGLRDQMVKPASSSPSSLAAAAAQKKKETDAAAAAALTDFSSSVNRDIDVECIIFAMTAIAADEKTPAKERTKFLNRLAGLLDMQLSVLPALRSLRLATSYSAGGKQQHQQQQISGDDSRSGGASHTSSSSSSSSSSLRAAIASSSSRALPVASLTNMMSEIAVHNLPVFSVFRICGKCFVAPGVAQHMTPQDAVKALAAYAAFGFRDDFVIRALVTRCFALKRSILASPVLSRQCAEAMKAFHISFETMSANTPMPQRTQQLGRQ